MVRLPLGISAPSFGSIVTIYELKGLRGTALYTEIIKLKS